MGRSQFKPVRKAQTQQTNKGTNSLSKQSHDWMSSIDFRIAYKLYLSLAKWYVYSKERSLLPCFPTRINIIPFPNQLQLLPVAHYTG